MKPKKKALVIRPAAAQEMVLMKSNSFHMCLQKIKTPLGYSPPLRNQRGREAFVLQHCNQVPEGELRNYKRQEEYIT